jgi:hypothetical protein
MFGRMRAWLTRGRRNRAQAPPVPASGDRSSGEDAKATIEGVGAEATPSQMNRLKTDRL